MGFFPFFHLCLFTKVLMCYIKEAELVSCNICKLTRVVIIISHRIGNKWASKMLHYKNNLKDHFEVLKSLIINEEE